MNRGLAMQHIFPLPPNNTQMFDVTMPPPLATTFPQDMRWHHEREIVPSPPASHNTQPLPTAPMSLDPSTKKGKNKKPTAKPSAPDIDRSSPALIPSATTKKQKKSSKKKPQPTWIWTTEMEVDLLQFVMGAGTDVRDHYTHIIEFFKEEYGIQMDDQDLQTRFMQLRGVQKTVLKMFNRPLPAPVKCGKKSKMDGAKKGKKRRAEEMEEEEEGDAEEKREMQAEEADNKEDEEMAEEADDEGDDQEVEEVVQEDIIRGDNPRNPLFLLLEAAKYMGDME